MITALIIISVLSMVGIVEAIYLIHGRVKSRPLVCPIGGDCSVVLESHYNKTFGIHNDVLGLLGYVAIGLSTIFSILTGGPERLYWRTNEFAIALKVFVIVGSILSLFFTYIQWRVIKHWCFWCLMSAFTMWTMAVILYFFT